MSAHAGQAEFLGRFVCAVGDGLRRRAAARALLWALAGGLAALGAALLADAVFAFPASARAVVYAATALAGVGASAGVVLRARLKRPSSLYVARLIERGRPELKNTLITFLELASDPQEDASAREAVGRRAARILGETRPAAFLPPYHLRRAGMAAACMAGILAAGLWLAQGVLIAPWIEGAEAGIMARGGPSGPDASCGAAPGAAASAAIGPEERATGARDGSGTNGGPTPSADDAAAGGPGARGGGGPGTGRPGFGRSAGAQALASAIRGDGPRLDQTARALGQEGIAGGSGQSDGGAGQGPAGGAQGARNESGDQGEPDATGTSDPSATGGGEAGEGGTSRPDGRGADGTAGEPSPGAGGSGGSSSSGPTGGRDRPPIPERPQTTDFPPEALDAIKAARRIIHEAQERLRDGEVTEGFLGEVGMSREEFRRFVVTWQRRLDTAARGLDVTAAPEAARAVDGTGQAQVLLPGRADAARAVRGVEPGTPDAIELFAGDASCVSPRLAPAVSAYFEAVGRLAAPREKPKGGK